MDVTPCVGCRQPLVDGTCVNYPSCNYSVATVAGLLRPNEPCRIDMPHHAPESVLSEAARLVDGDRQTAYGHPKDNHATTAALWEAYLNRSNGGNLTHWRVDAFDVCMLNILQKVSRLAHTRQRDGLVDIAGFARNAELVEDA